MSLFLALPAAHAQQLPPGWTAVPCDANGNTANGSASLTGTQSGSVTRTGAYKDIEGFIRANPNYYLTGNYESTAAYYLTPAFLNDGSTVATSVIEAGSSSDLGSMEGLDAYNYYSYGGEYGFFNPPPGAPYPSFGEPIMGSLKTTVSGTLTAYYKCVWQGRGTQPAYPDHLDLKIQTTVRTGGGVNYGASGLTSGMTATANASDSYGETNSASIASPTDVSPASVLGSHLVRASVDPGTGIAQASVSGSTQMMVDNEVQFTDNPGRGTYYNPTVVRANASVSAQSQIDSRDVTINRDGTRSPGKVYSPDGQLHGEYVDASGVGHGETTYSYFLGPPGGSSPTRQPNWQSFHPTFSGAWSQINNGNLLAPGTIPNVTWTWIPNESDDTQYLGKCEMPDSAITYYTNGTSSGKSAGSKPYPVTYTAGDNGDQAKATATYSLVVHDQWDNLRLDPAHPFDVVDQINLVQANGVNYPPHLNLDYTKDAPVGPLTLAVTVGTQFVLGLTGSFKLADFFTLGGSFTASASLSFAANQTITGPTIPPRCYTQLTQEVHYHINHWLTDHYLPSGYDATYTQLIAAPGALPIILYWGHPIQLAGSGLGGA